MLIVDLRTQYSLLAPICSLGCFCITDVSQHEANINFVVGAYVREKESEYETFSEFARGAFSDGFLVA